jgi:hypothetical protein
MSTRNVGADPSLPKRSEAELTFELALSVSTAVPLFP